MAIATLYALAPTPAAGQTDRLVPSCTPELVYAFRAGTVDAEGSGVAYAPTLELTDDFGVPVVTGGADIEWSVRSVVTDPGMAVGARPRMSGALSLIIT